MFNVKKAFALLASGVILCSGAQVFAADKEEKKMETEQEKISYALGYNIGQNLKRDYEVDLDMFFKGITESHEGKSSLSEEEMQQTMMTFQNKMKEKQMAQMKESAEANKEAGEAFLKENKGKDGIVTLESGLQYKVITQGDGEKPQLTDTVKCHYKGTTIDGNEFDSSYKRGEPASFKVNGVIKGWTEALQLMTVGSKWMLYIPSDLAYGDRGAGRSIAPGSTLIFEVELLGIE
ncbi:FKBP-type peptidyl-prolyl cis-trans isomerase (rotamase) [Desulfamplus magnetovallimortis]|uniref:Peptidyl-prolyl cis-trans isomerase n=1 Tax=Desulfamplus magnetovallimortis TaxID=1246637 RepID=A0A1W1H9Q7_9BACT|nr:FKBP-type peptidyl-prolyl cis-trans isomerase [Desulfamplus magnetovallimortis]SLM29108.1 FKBP-type peptidyl-prolyl cis-trans isomerase (rotamase) [Desulfamplus magnetovallimortis]